MKDEIKKDIERIKSTIEKIKETGGQIFLVEANPEEGYSYPYILYYPKEGMKTTLVIDCLNDYEEEMIQGETENVEAIEEIYSLFGENRISSDSPLENTDKVQEDKEKSLGRMAYRIAKGTVPFYPNTTLLIGRFPNAPIIMPLIPGFKDGETHEDTCSELGEGVAREIAPQIISMIKSAKQIVKANTSITLEDKVIASGFSKSSEFMNHFAMLYPEQIKAMILGGIEYIAPPIEEIRLIVDDNRGENEEFEIRDGIPYKKITEKELGQIIEEYKKSKKEFQKDIVLNEDGSYSLPLNYPVGIADIEHYREDFPEEFPSEKYMKDFSSIPRVIFVGEDEEKVEGSYAYFPGVTIEGEKIAYGDDLQPFEKKREHLFEIEHAGMHNRVLDYIEALRILFGRSDNERSRNLIDLYTKLGVNFQSKIYKNIGHFDGFDNNAVIEDLNLIYESLVENNRVPVLGDNERASRIVPIYQLLRRYRVSRSKEEYESKREKWDAFTKKNKDVDRITERKRIVGKIQGAVNEYLAQRYDLNNPGINIDRLYDDLTTKELEEIFERVFEISRSQENTGKQEEHKKTIGKVEQSQSVLSRSGIEKLAKSKEVVMEDENTTEIMKKIEEVEKLPKDSKEKSV